MSKRHEEFCSNPGCGAILKLSAELDTGICLACLQRGECGEREKPCRPSRFTRLAKRRRHEYLS